MANILYTPVSRQKYYLYRLLLLVGGREFCVQQPLGRGRCGIGGCMELLINPVQARASFRQRVGFEKYPQQVQKVGHLICFGRGTGGVEDNAYANVLKLLNNAELSTAPAGTYAHAALGDRRG